MIEQDKIITFKISSKTLKKLKEISKNSKISLSKLIRIFIENYIKELESGKTLELVETIKIDMKK